MSAVPAALRRNVIERAKNRCEYCRLSQLGQEATFHIDHVIPVVAGGETVIDNLALACVSCSLRKAAREKATDPETEQEVSLSIRAATTGGTTSVGKASCLLASTLQDEQLLRLWH